MSNTIHTPRIVSGDDHSATSATFSIEPLHSGYGMTLGNSLRRVLLSSIAGAAITAFKIEGITHEFTTVKGDFLVWRSIFYFLTTKCMCKTTRSSNAHCIF